MTSGRRLGGVPASTPSDSLPFPERAYPKLRQRFQERRFLCSIKRLSRAIHFWLSELLHHENTSAREATACPLEITERFRKETLF
jgi:hypothetical protein